MVERKHREMGMTPVPICREKFCVRMYVNEGVFQWPGGGLLAVRELPSTALASLDSQHLCGTHWTLCQESNLLNSPQQGPLCAKSPGTDFLLPPSVQSSKNTFHEERAQCPHRKVGKQISLGRWGRTGMDRCLFYF